MKTIRQIVIILSILVIAETAGNGFISTDLPEKIGIFIWQRPYITNPYGQFMNCPNNPNH